ncbi:MAG TPA: acyl-CoA thioesterase [Candidatus Limnocylindrales bacterium]|jgi:acyl-CoA hydrolase|nr:acyl-CoA thioesterase [Candidatus Limnocylindrales bacterium]
MVELVLPNDANTQGNVLGGRVLHWIDLAAAIVAHRHCRTETVTVSLDQMSFLAPIKIGQLALIAARMTFTGRTSMEIRVDVQAEDLLTGERRQTSTAYLTFVAIDKQGRPATVPPLLLETDEDRREWREAEGRRAARLKARQGTPPTRESIHQ